LNFIFADPRFRPKKIGLLLQKCFAADPIMNTDVQIDWGPLFIGIAVVA
jgi:hypothetical protein